MKQVIRWLPIIILLLAIGLRVHAIDNQSLWHDEGNSLRLAERSADDLLEATSHDIHPPGYYLILKGWLWATGDSEFALRTLSALWGLLAVTGTYALGKRLFGDYVAMLAALLIAVNPFAVYYSQETRMYAQLTAVSVLSLWVFAVMMRKVHRRFAHGLPLTRITYISSWALSLGLINALGMYTHYSFPATIATQIVLFGWWYWRARDEHLLVSFISVNVLSFLIFLPWLFNAYDQITSWPSTGDATPFLDRLERTITILFYGQTIETLTIGLLALPLGLIIVAVFIAKPRRLTEELPYAWRLMLPFVLIVLILGGLLFSGAYREANLKFLLPAQIAAAIVVSMGARGLLRVLREWQPDLPVSFGYGLAAAPVLVLALINVNQLDKIYNDSAFARSDYRHIAQTITRTSSSDDAIILNAPNQQEVFSYYYDGELAVYPLPRDLRSDLVATRAELNTILDRHRRIYLVVWGDQERDPQGVIQSTLNEQAFFVSHDWYNDVQLLQYEVLGDVSQTPQHLLGVTFGENLRLEGFTLSDDSFSAGRDSVIGVTLYWQSLNTLDKTYKVSVQLLYPDGKLAAQGQDSTLSPSATSQRDSQAIVLQSPLPVGTYTLITSVYDPNMPREGRLSPSANEFGDNAVFLADIELR